EVRSTSRREVAALRRQPARRPDGSSQTAVSPPLLAALVATPRRLTAPPQTLRAPNAAPLPPPLRQGHQPRVVGALADLGLGRVAAQAGQLVVGGEGTRRGQARRPVDGPDRA